MKHWYTTITTGQDDSGSYTVCTQKFFIDQDRFLFDLKGAFLNAGISIDAQGGVYIIRHSTLMADDKGVRLPMAPVADADRIILGALAAGIGKSANAVNAGAYVMHMMNVLGRNAMAAYMNEWSKAHAFVPSEAGGDEET